MRILMVCLGNICRSPLAEGILRDKVNKAGLNWIIDSAGTNGYQPGCPPHLLSQKVAEHNGVTLQGQQCRQFTKNDMDLFDKIYVMDEENYYDVKRISGNKWDEKKVDFLLNEIYSGQNRIVPDPWSRGEDDFHTVFALINKACEAIVEKYALVKV
jgi:protein-tyrosine phosphatase